MHRVVTRSDIRFAVPSGYDGHGRGFGRATYVDAACGAVHSGMAVWELEPGGELAVHVHSYEEGFYILEGEAIVGIDGHAWQLVPQDYGLFQVGVAHSWRNAGSTPLRWLEMVSPQPRDTPQDTFFIPGPNVPAQGARPDFKDPRTRFIGHFDDSQLPPPSQLQMDGYSGGNVTSIQLKYIVDRTLGAQHLTMFIVQFQPGGAGNVHDHPFEECYFLMAGAADCILDGQKYHVRAGDIVWSGVGATHGFFNTGTVPVRWLETQSPQPPGQQAFRFTSDWEHLAQQLSARD